MFSVPVQSRKSCDMFLPRIAAAKASELARNSIAHTAKARGDTQPASQLLFKLCHLAAS